MSTRTSLVLVAVTSGLVLVLEILAGRLLAPYIGVSLETFTGIIGTILAGIAAGAAVGGRLADRHDPLRLIAGSLLLGGGLTWASVPIARLLGPDVGAGPVAIVVLTASAFLLPAAVLSGIGPMVAKLQLGSLDSTGSVVGALSGASTFGALVGTFGTGFVLITFFGVQQLIFAIGLVLVLSGAIVYWRTGARPEGPAVLLVVAAAGASLLVESPCDYETSYYCVRVVADQGEGARPGGRSLYLDQARHAHVDLDDPTHLEIRYMRLLADVVDAHQPGAVAVLHVGGGGFALPRYIEATRPGSTQVVLELDEELVDIAAVELGLADAGPLDIRTGDARLNLDELPDARYDLVIVDVFSGLSVPWHLTTIEVMDELSRVLKPDGVLAMNVIDEGNHGFARAELATVRTVFGAVAVVGPSGGLGPEIDNQIFLASDQPLEGLVIDPFDGELLDGAEVDTYIGSAPVLRDDFAPADQLAG